jgi:hypothetical protein
MFYLADCSSLVASDGSLYKRGYKPGAGCQNSVYVSTLKGSKIAPATQATKFDEMTC